MIRTTFLPNIDCPNIVGTCRDFGAIRNNGDRIHAGIDLYAPIGSNIVFNVGNNSNGMVTSSYKLFFRESYSISIYSFYLGVTIRFCEISKPYKPFKTNDCVKFGDVIGTIADIDMNNAMLHLEMYYGMLTRFESNKTKTRRIKDLISPWEYKKYFLVKD